MKNLLLPLLFLCISNIYAQEIRESNASMSKGANNAFVMEISGTTVAEAREAWAKFMKDYDAKTKFDKKLNESFTDNAVIPGMSDNTVDVYSAFQQAGQLVRMTVWYDLGGAYLNSPMHGKKVEAAQVLMKKFATTVSKTLQEEIIKAEKKKLEGLQDDLKDLVKQKTGFEKDIENYRRDIENYKKKIAEAENNIELTKGKIENNVNDQKKKQGEVDTQSDKVKEEEKKLEELK